MPIEFCEKNQSVPTDWAGLSCELGSWVGIGDRLAALPSWGTTRRRFLLQRDESVRD
jgi:hypothetical protein